MRRVAHRRRRARWLRDRGGAGPGHARHPGGGARHPAEDVPEAFRGLQEGVLPHRSDERLEVLRLQDLGPRPALQGGRPRLLGRRQGAGVPQEEPEQQRPDRCRRPPPHHVVQRRSEEGRPRGPRLGPAPQLPAEVSRSCPRFPPASFRVRLADLQTTVG